MSFEKLTKYLDALPEIYGIPICELSVRHKHELVYRHSVGNLPHGKNTLYELYSMTKLFTVTATMQLVEKGEIGLDDPVYKYLPAYKNLTFLQNGTVVPARKVLTIRHLLSMRGGLSYNKSVAFHEACKNNATTREIADIIADIPLLFEPGDNWFYSLAHDVLGAVLEVAAGKKFSEILNENIIKPLGISDMGFFPDDEQKSRFAPIFKFNPLDYTSTPSEIDFVQYVSTKYESGGGGLFGSNDEYMKLPDALANGGVGANGVSIIKPETIALIKENQLTPSEVHEFYVMKPGYGYGLGVRTLIYPEQAGSPGPVGEFGWDGALASYSMVDTDNNIAVVWTTHMRDCNPAYREIHPHLRNLVYKGILK